MKQLTTVLVALFIIQMTGCAITSYRESSEQIEQLIKEKRYGRALDRLSEVTPSDPDFSRVVARQREVEASVSLYEQSIFSEAEILIGKGRWDQALDLYDEALSRLPKSVTLKTGLVELQDKQWKKSQELERDNLLPHGEWLVKSLPIYREIARVNPRDKHAQSDYRRLQEEAEQVSEELEAHGTDALDRGDDKGARRFLTLALELNPTASLKEKLTCLESRKKEAQRKERLSKKRQQKKEAQRTRHIAKQITRYDKQVEAKEYLAARSTLTALEKLGWDKDKVARRSEGLEQVINREKDRLFSKAVTNYSRGQYEKAAKLWRKIIELDPDHAQARENLDRAEGVLRKLEELRKKKSN